MPLCGLKVIVRPPWLVVVHCVADGQARSYSTLNSSLSIVTGVAGAGACGLNVTSPPPSLCTAVHWVVAGHVTWPSCSLAPSVIGVAPAGAAGLKVTSLVELVAVHWVAEAQATDCSPKSSPGSRDVIVAPEGDVGSKVTRLPLPSTSMQSDVEAQATPLAACAPAPPACGSTRTGVGEPGCGGIERDRVAREVDGRALRGRRAGQAVEVRAGIEGHRRGPRGDCGLKVRTRPLASRATHSVLDGQASEPMVTPAEPSIAWAADHSGAAAARGHGGGEHGGSKGGDGRRGDGSRARTRE